MEFLRTDDQTQPLPLITATDTQRQDLDCVCLLQSPTENMLSEIPTENPSGLSGPSEKNTKPLPPHAAPLSLEQSTRSQSLNNEPCAFNTSHSFLLCSKIVTKDEDLRVLDYCDTSEPIVSPGEQVTCLTTDFGSPQSTIITVQEHISQPLTPCHLLSTPETLPEQCAAKPLFSDSSKSDECQAVGLLKSLSHQSDSSESSIATVPLSDLYIFESEMQDFILSPNLDSQEIKCHEYVPLPQTKAELQCDKDLGLCDTFKVMTKYDQDLSEEQVYELGPPAMNASDVAQEKAEVTGRTPRNESPVELWVDACQYLAVDEAEDRNETVQSVMQDALSTATSNFSVPTEETQGSGCRPKACDVIGWSFDDNKSWGPPVERWSSVDSWASALSDWAEIISTPAEDFTAAFTEIGAEIDALTQALAEVTTQTEAEQPSKKPVDGLDQSPMVLQDRPLEAQNITESSANTCESCLSCCPRAEIQEKRGIEPLCTTENELGKNSCQSEPQQQSMGSSEEVSSERYSEEDTTAHTVTQGATFETVTDFLDFCDELQQTDVNNEVVLNIVEDTDLEEKSAPAGLLINKPSTDSKCEVKDGHIFSLDLEAERDSERSSGPPETLNVLNTLTTTNTHVPRADTEPGLNAHVLPNTSADLDRACQVEPQWGSPKFIIPLAPLDIGSSLVTCASSSLKGDQEATKWGLNEYRGDIYDHTEAYNLRPDSDGITYLSLESTEDVPQQKQSETDSSDNSLQDLKTDETIKSYIIESKTIFEESRDLLNLAVIPNDRFIVSEEKRVACFTLDLYDPFASLASKPIKATAPSVERMPHKTNKSSSESKMRPKKDKSTCPHHGANVSNKQEKLSYNVVAEQQPSRIQDDLTEVHDTGLENKESELVTETGMVPQKGSSKHHGKKKKKHTGKSTAEPLAEVENEAKVVNAKTDVIENKAVTKSSDQSAGLHKTSDNSSAKPLPKDKQPKNTSTPNDDVIKKRRLSQNKFGKLISSFESKLPNADTSKGAEDKVDAGTTRRKAYSEVVKQKTATPKQDPKVVQPIQATSVSGDPQSLCLWCQFSGLFTDYTVTWSRDSAVLAEIKRSAGDESRVSQTISNASHKDLGKYQCRLSSTQGTVTLDYVLTYELLSEIVIPPTPKTIPSAPVQAVSEEENVNCSKLMFKEDFLTQQFFGEKHSASIITEQSHFGEGMHRRAFRTKLQTGHIPLLLPGHSCVLKVHNAFTYGTKNNEELVQKNFNLAVEECQVQNTAREYIKAYTAVAQSFESFGEVPEIIPIYLVHRPSNDIPYATLEEELIGDFVKYSVKDGKEINLMRRDSEAGQKCCTFQHWVYHNTEGNLLVTDMQGVGMKLTDVGIATCKKGYKGFKGNCAMSFIDQFKALHQCNTYCEILGLKSLQPKPKKTAPPPKSKAQPGAAPKKKTFEPTVKGKS